MNTARSTATSTCEYQPTIIESRFLIERLAIQLAFLRTELKVSWREFKTNPAGFTKQKLREFSVRLRTLLFSPYFVQAALVSIGILTCLIAGLIRIDNQRRIHQPEIGELVVVHLGPPPPMDVIACTSIGIDGPGRVGFGAGRGEGSGPSPKRASGGGGGGDHNPIPAQTGELPQPSEIPAPIPTTPPVNPPALPVAGMDIDPALWKDLKAPVYGDPRSQSQTESKGPGEGGGIGSNNGMGIGEGNGQGFGPGRSGNIGGGPKGIGGGGEGGGSGAGVAGRLFRGNEVEQRARVLFKPEPQYTEEARRNQAVGTVVLSAVFSSTGEVVQIRALRTLPFGLTERAIAAARQIRFEPAIKGGQPVSVFMQLEYNFNLY
jgi:TonB family protein